jgi:hypothetical protein
MQSQNNTATAAAELEHHFAAIATSPPHSIAREPADIGAAYSRRLPRPRRRAGGTPVQ